LPPRTQEQMANMPDENTGRRLPAAFLDNLAKTNPDRKYAVIPNGTDISDGFRDLTIREVAQAVNYTSWWIQKVLGPTTKPETVSYMASNDVRYIIFVWACNKTGYTVRQSENCLYAAITRIPDRLDSAAFSCVYKELRRCFHSSSQSYQLPEICLQPRAGRSNVGSQKYQSRSRNI
jgi:hypothetical protein